MAHTGDPNNSTGSQFEEPHDGKQIPTSSAIQASKALAAIAMEGSNPWQKIIVYACFGVILGSICVVGLPPYHSSKQLTVFGTLAGNLLISVIFIFYRYNSLRRPEQEPRRKKGPAVKHQAISDSKMHRSFGIAWTLAIAIGFVLIFGSRITGYDPLWIVFPSWNQSMQSGFLIRGITDGIRRDRDFMIEAVTILIQIEDSTINQRFQRRTVIRTLYTVRALKDISKDSVVFTEEYSAGSGEEVIYWHGSNVQRLNIDTPDTKKFDVLFDARKGENHTLITGATLLSYLPLSERHDRGLRFASNEDMAFYPNESDAVCEVNIVIESITSPLKLPRLAAIRYKKDGSLHESTAITTSDAAGAANTTTLAARWTDVSPGEVVALRFSW